MTGFINDGYSIAAFGMMAADGARIGAYSRALEQVITPQSVVVEIGTGSGIMALRACQLGAARVYAIEPDSSIEAARASAIANGYADRIVFLRDLSTNVTLPEAGDILFSDLRGILPLHNHHLESIIDARTRLLKPGGVQIGARDTLYAAPVSAPALYRRQVEPWADNPFGLDLSAGRRWTINCPFNARVTPDVLVGAPQVWADLDYRTLTALNYAATLTWTFDQPQTVHAIQTWFVADLYEGISYSSAPDQPRIANGNTCFPLATPAAITAGGALRVTLRADNLSGQYTFSWATEVLDAAGATVTRMGQSTAFANWFSPKSR